MCFAGPDDGVAAVLDEAPDEAPEQAPETSSLESDLLGDAEDALAEAQEIHAIGADPVEPPPVVEDSPAVQDTPGALPYEELNARRLDQEQQAAWFQLLRNSVQAEDVLIGRIMTSRSTLLGEQIVTLEIERSLRGDSVGIIEFMVQKAEDLQDPLAVPTRIVRGYRVLVYLDRERTLVAGNALYFLQGGYAWRNKRSSLFLSPFADRVWVDNIDPRRHYIVFDMGEVDQALNLREAKKRLRKKRTRRTRS